MRETASQTLKQDFQEAVDDYLDMCSEQGVKPEKVYRGSFNIRISPDLHRKISLYAAAKKCSLNSVVEQAYSNWRKNYKGFGFLSI